MIITRTPVRISFLGGGSDYPEHYCRHGGQTLGLAIDKYSYVTVKRLPRLFDYSIRISYSKTELVNAIDEIQHPAVRECLRFLGVDGGLEIHYMGDLPARTGLGSSSSFTVGLLHALHAFRGEHVGVRQLAEEAVHVEQRMIQERVGVQDQYTCAHGGLLHLQFTRDRLIKVGRIAVRAERLRELEAHLLLFYTGVRRNAHEVLDEQLERTRNGALTDTLTRLEKLVDHGLEALTSRQPLGRFGKLLDEAWTLKCNLSSKVSTPVIDEHYRRAMAAGALGGKLLGAGGGGFLLLLADPMDHARIEAALDPLQRVQFACDFGGSTVLVYQP